MVLTRAEKLAAQAQAHQRRSARGLERARTMKNAAIMVTEANWMAVLQRHSSSMSRAGYHRQRPRSEIAADDRDLVGEADGPERSPQRGPGAQLEVLGLARAHGAYGQPRQV